MNEGPLESYFLVEELGRGTFSTVYKAVHRTTLESFAIKCIEIEEDRKQAIAREVSILSRLHHKNIVTLFEVHLHGNMIFLVTELASEGELFRCILQQGEYPEETSRKMVSQILRAVSYLHAHGIAHRDLKPQNILITTREGKQRLLLADFGLSKAFNDEIMFTSCGSPEYVAPEVLANAPYTQACDIWSVGVIAFILLTGELPFSVGPNETPEDLYAHIEGADYQWPTEVHVSRRARSFVDSILVVDPSARESADGCLRHPWIIARASRSPTYRDFTNYLRHRSST
jgi:protein serine kinase H